MDIALNNAPELTMAEITKRLFNNKFLSDIQFNIDGKVIFAHSLELMKRSLVFQKQLETTLGDSKMIIVVDAGYDSFYQFMQFLYTDECKMDESYGMELLKLAIHYKVVRLENKMIEYLIACDASVLLELYEFSIANNYELVYNRVKGEIAWYLNFCLESEKFLSLPQTAVVELLQMDYVYKDIKEEEIFNGLVRWMNHYCEKHLIEATERRTRFDNLIRLIRFPTMKFEGFRDCAAKHRDLFTDDDFVVIFKLIAFGANDKENPGWRSTPRLEYKLPVEYREFAANERFETKFTVSQEVILAGLRYGNELNKVDHKIFITAFNRHTGEAQVSKFKCAAQKTVFEHNIISVGESIRLQTNFIYTIGFKFFAKNPRMDILCRGENQDMIVNDKQKAVKIMERGSNMIEIIFKAPVPNSCDVME